MKLYTCHCRQVFWHSYNGIGILQNRLFGLIPIYVFVKKLYFHQVLEQKNTKQKSYTKSFKIV